MLARLGEGADAWALARKAKSVRAEVQNFMAAFSKASNSLAPVRSLRPDRQQLSSFLLHHGHHCYRPAWTLMHCRWMGGLGFEQAAHNVMLEDCVAAVEAAAAVAAPVPVEAAPLDLTGPGTGGGNAKGR